MKRRLLCSLLVAVGLFVLPLMAGGAEKVVFVDNSWDSIQVLNRIAGFILEKGYGFDAEYLFAETLPGLMGVERGEAQVIMEVWVDNYGDWYEKAEARKQIIPLGENYPGAPQGWYVPTYVIKGDPERGIEPMAPDLEYIQDLPQYWELFKSPEVPTKGRFYNGPTGWVISTITESKFKTTGLDEYFEVFFPGSDMALSTAAATAYKRGLPVLIYYWEPSWLLGLYDMTLLKDKVPYSEERWVEGDYGCDYPRSRVWKMANAAFLEKHPEVRGFLERFETTLDQNNKALAYMKAKEVDPKEAALWFLREYPENWKSWIGDDKKSAAVAEALKK